VSSGGGFDDEPEHEEEESFGRPFLGRVMRAETAEVVPSNESDDGHEENTTDNHRPYLLTGGRTGGGASGIGIETLLVRDTSVIPRQTSWSPEMSKIIAACDSAVAVAEVAARIGLPIGVVQVLAGDLVTSGVLLRSMQPSTSLADDVLFIERLINGVAAL
jgi:hypothetical protein